MGYWDQKNQSDLQIWCTPGNKNARRVPTNILLPNRCHKFYLIWCDISKSHCEEDPSNYAGLNGEELLKKPRTWKRFFTRTKKRIFSHGSVDGILVLLSLILCQIYQRSAKSQQPVSRVPILVKFSNDFSELLDFFTFSITYSLGRLSNNQNGNLSWYLP